MTRAQAAKRRVPRGVRAQQALNAIRTFEKQGVAWRTVDLAGALGVSANQASNLVDQLFRRGWLVLGDRAVVLPNVPVLAKDVVAPAAQVA